MDDLGELIEQLQALRNNAYMLYCPAVDEVLSGEVADINDITSVLDGLCDFCDEDRFLQIGISHSLASHHSAFSRRREASSEFVSSFIPFTPIEIVSLTRTYYPLHPRHYYNAALRCGAHCLSTTLLYSHINLASRI